MSTMQHVYFDESGFTGPNLMDDNQPYFIYAGVAISPDEAETMTKSAATTLRCSVEELKAGELLKSSRGRKVVVDVVGQLIDRTYYTMADKKYALCGKFFEYVFEPVLSSANSAYYGCGFHRFIQQLLYAELISSKDARVWMTSFQEWMRKGDSKHLLALVEAISSKGGPLAHMYWFVDAHQAQIMAEVEGLRADGGQMDPWILELSTTSLFNLLARFGEQFPGAGLSVVCDDSAPIKASANFFDVMVGRKDRQQYPMAFDGRTRPITFNLAHPIATASSKTTPGLQIADLCSGGLNYMLTNRGTADAKRLSKIFASRIESIDIGIVPEWEHIDLDSPRGWMNGMILYGLGAMSQSGENISDNPGIVPELAFSATLQKFGHPILANRVLGMKKRRPMGRT